MDDADSRVLHDKATVVLESVDLDHYYGDLCLVDEAIGSLGRALADHTPAQRAAFSETLSTHARRVLGRFMLRAGLLIRVVLEQRVRDWRDDLVELAPYYYAAQQVGPSPHELFDDAADLAVPELATIMRNFGRRPDVTLAAFGWRRIENPEGPTFEMLGWKGERTGAVVGSPSWDAVNGAMVRDLLQWIESQGARKRSEQA